MQPLYKRVQLLQAELTKTYQQLQIDAKEKSIKQLDADLSVPEVWNNPKIAQTKSRQVAALRATVDPWKTLRAQVQDIAELMSLGDKTLLDEFDEQITALEKEYENRRKDLLLMGEYDSSAAIMRITAGVGGTDAQDWAAMLERMYLRWAERHDMKTHLVERSSGEEAGIKTTVFEVSGAYAYGKLKSEHGVHRLVRLSPFNSDHLRQTSFALVEVLPQIDEPEAVDLNEKDLRIDVYHSGGHGGQGVNTTDSAVRVTHLPTGIVVAIQNERSQIQNRETALTILRSKLAQLQLEQHAASVDDLRAGESANWGSQIRNYVLHPYTLVKDTRTKYEDRDVQGVLDGKLDGFIDAYLQQLVSE